jgi:hypothetical protein
LQILPFARGGNQSGNERTFPVVESSRPAPSGG